MKIHFIQQSEWVEPGEYLAWAKRRGHETTMTRCWKYEALPENPVSDFLIVLGGPQCPATTKDECGFFDAAAERRLIRKYADEGKIVVGICLGAQLLGEALGAPYSRSPEREIGPVSARLTEEGRLDPLLGHFPEVFLAGAWHNDMPGLTEDSSILAKSDGCPRQIVRYGRYLYGFQTHMEFTKEIIRQGILHDEKNLEIKGRFIQSKEQLLSFDYTEMNGLLSEFLDKMTSDYISRGDDPKED